MVTAVSNVNVPRITLFHGVSHGAGNYGMAGKAYNPRFIFSWPNHRVAVMGPKQLAGVMEIVARNAAAGRGIEVDEEQLGAQKEALEAQIEGESSALYATGRVWDDGIIHPNDSRTALGLDDHRRQGVRFLALHPLDVDRQRAALTRRDHLQVLRHELVGDVTGDFDADLVACDRAFDGGVDETQIKEGVVADEDRARTGARLDGPAHGADGLAEAGYDILNEVVLNQVLVSFGDAPTTLAVIEGIQADGTCWCGGTVWQGRRAMRISICNWSTTTADVDVAVTQYRGAVDRLRALAPGRRRGAARRRGARHRAVPRPGHEPRVRGLRATDQDRP